MSSTLRALTPREASIYACLVDTYCGPRGDFPAVRDTTAVAFFDEWVGSAPVLNRLALRGLLYLCEVGPLPTHRRRLRRLDPERRLEFVRRLDRSPIVPLRAAGKLMKVAASLGYYGDSGVLRRIGYDPEAIIERARRLRREEGRP